MGGDRAFEPLRVIVIFKVGEGFGPRPPARTRAPAPGPTAGPSGHHPPPRGRPANPPLASPGRGAGGSTETPPGGGKPPPRRAVKQDKTPQGPGGGAGGGACGRVASTPRR